MKTSHDLNLERKHKYIETQKDTMQVEGIPLAENFEQALQPMDQEPENFKLQDTTEKIPLTQENNAQELQLVAKKSVLMDLPEAIFKELVTFLDPQTVYELSRIMNHQVQNNISGSMNSIKEILQSSPWNLVNPKILFKNLDNNHQAIELFLQKKPNKEELERVLGIDTKELLKEFNEGRWPEIKEKFTKSNPLLLAKLSESYYLLSDTQIRYILQLMALAASNYQMIHLLPEVAYLTLKGRVCLALQDCIKSWVEVEKLPVISDIKQVVQVKIFLSRLQSFWGHRNPKVLVQRLKNLIHEKGYNSSIKISILKLPPQIATSELAKQKFPKWLYEFLEGNSSIPPLESWTSKQIKRLKKIPCESLPQLIDDKQIEETLRFIELFEKIPLKIEEIKNLCDKLKSFEKKEILEIFQTQEDLVAFNQVVINGSFLSHFIISESTIFLKSLLRKYSPSQLKEVESKEPVLVKVVSFFKYVGDRSWRVLQRISKIDFNILTALQESPIDINTLDKSTLGDNLARYTDNLDLLLESINEFVYLGLSSDFFSSFWEFFANNLKVIKRFLLILAGNEKLVVGIIEGLEFDWRIFEKVLKNINYKSERICFLKILTNYSSSSDLIILLIKHFTSGDIIDTQALEDTLLSLKSLTEYDEFIIEILIKTAKQFCSHAPEIETVKNKLFEKEDLLQFLNKNLQKFSNKFKDIIRSAQNPIEIIEDLLNKNINLTDRSISFLEVLISLPQFSDRYSGETPALQTELLSMLFPRRTTTQSGTKAIPLDQEKFEEMSRYLPILLKFSKALNISISNHPIFYYLGSKNFITLFNIKEKNGDPTPVSLLEAFLYILPAKLSLLEECEKGSRTLIPFLEQKKDEIFANYREEFKKEKQAVSTVAHSNQQGKNPSAFFPTPYNRPRQMLPEEQKLFILFRQGSLLIQETKASDNQRIAKLQKICDEIKGTVDQLKQQHLPQTFPNNNVQVSTQSENKRKKPDSDEPDQPETKKPSTQMGNG